MKTRSRIAGLLLAVSFFLSGCGQLEIEERAFPLALCVTAAKEQGAYEFSFYFEEMDSDGSSLYHKENATVTAGGYPQAYTIFGRVQAAQLDDSHVKVILLSESLLEDEGFWDSFCHYAMKEHHFSWNTMIYLIEDGSEVPLELADGTDNHPGSYLRDMAESDEQERTAGVPTLGDLYMECNNREKTVLLPVLTGGNPPFVGSYRIMEYGTLRGTLQPDDARLLQLLQGKLKKMQLELADGTQVGIGQIWLGREYVRERACWQVTVHLAGQVQNQVALTPEEAARTEEAVTTLLQEQIRPVAGWAKLRDGGGQLVQPEYVIDFHLTESITVPYFHSPSME